MASLCAFTAFYFFASRGRYIIIFSKEPKEGRYFLFKNVDIVIEAECDYLFNKCLTVLGNMRFNITEVDRQDKKIEACQIQGFHAAIITLSIKGYGNSEKSFMIAFHYQEVPEDKEAPEDEIDAMVSLPRKSRIINCFIDQLVSKPGKRAEKANDTVT
jgi:hypothetical protein